nr:MAG TPA: hypothetical protein [Caudoviricetes sp.]
MILALVSTTISTSFGIVVELDFFLKAPLFYLEKRLVHVG